MSESQKRSYVKYRENNREIINNCVRRYRNKNKEKEQISNRRSSLLYHARKKGFETYEDFVADITIKDIRKLFI